MNMIFANNKEEIYFEPDIIDIAHWFIINSINSISSTDVSYYCKKAEEISLRLTDHDISRNAEFINGSNQKLDDYLQDHTKIKISNCSQNIIKQILADRIDLGTRSILTLVLMNNSNIVNKNIAHSEL